MGDGLAPEGRWRLALWLALAIFAFHMKSMTADVSHPIVTSRLTLRCFEEADFQAYAAYHGRPEVYRYLYAAPPAGVDLETQFLAAMTPAFTEDGDVLRLAVARTTDGVLLGEVLLKLASRAALQAEIGYIFDPEAGGCGYASEAVSGLLDQGFGDLGLHRIFARLDAANAGSVGLFERLGLRREAHLVQNDRFNGIWGDEFIYAVLRSEWLKRRS